MIQRIYIPIIFFVITSISFYSCGFYYSNICSSCDPKLKFLQRIVDNPENIDSLLTNSVYFDKNFSKSTVAIFSKNNLNKISNYKGVQLNYLSSFEIKSTRIYNDKSQQKIDEVMELHLGVLFENNTDGILVIFEMRNDKWILIAVDIEKNIRLIEYFKEGGIFRNTLY